MRIAAIITGVIFIERGSVGMAHQPSPLLIVLGMGILIRGLYPGR